MLDEKNKIPKYMQIRNWLLGMINRGKIEIGEKIPTEEEIAKRFGVNRMTVRQALDEFVIEKMIVRKRGEGTILVSKRPQGYVYELENISSFNDDMESHGIEPIHEILKIEEVDVSRDIADRLELGDDNRAIHIMSVKKVEDEPVLIEKSYLPYKEFSDLLKMQINGPFYHLLVDKFGVRLDHATQIFSAVMPPEEEAEIFGIDNPLPCMLLESTVYDQNDIPIEVLFSYYRGDRYSFKAVSGEYLFDRPHVVV